MVPVDYVGFQISNDAAPTLAVLLRSPIEAEDPALHVNHDPGQRRGRMNTYDCRMTTKWLCRRHLYI